MYYANNFWGKKQSLLISTFVRRLLVKLQAKPINHSVFIRDERRGKWEYIGLASAFRHIKTIGTVILMLTM
jgi:hypothetical protein